MKIVSTILTFTLISCGDMNIEDNNVDTGKNTSGEETTSIEKDTAPAPKEYTPVEYLGPQVVGSYSLEHPSGIVDDYVGGDYCSGYDFRDCYLGGLNLVEYDNGDIKVEMEIIDTGARQQHVVVRKTIQDKKALLLTDSGKIASDNEFGSKKIWVIINLADRSIDVVYDLADTGPGISNIVLDTFYLSLR